jgi:hypothetical protein
MRLGASGCQVGGSGLLGNVAGDMGLCVRLVVATQFGKALLLSR